MNMKQWYTLFCFTRTMLAVQLCLLPLKLGGYELQMALKSLRVARYGGVIMEGRKIFAKGRLTKITLGAQVRVGFL